MVPAHPLSQCESPMVTQAPNISKEIPEITIHNFYWTMLFYLLIVINLISYYD